MNKHFAIVAIVAVLMFTIAANLFAADQLINAKIGSVIEKLDKNGNPFSVVIIEEQRTLNGVSYAAEVVGTAFRAAHEQAKQLKPGDTVKMIAEEREYNGSKAYTIRALVK